MSVINTGGGAHFKVELLKVDFSTMIMGVENFHHRGGNIGPPIEVEFSTIFIYSVAGVRRTT